jgi:hypothetical protein
VFYYFGLRRVVEMMFATPAWTSEHGTGRSTPGGYYTSPEAARMHDAAGVSIDDSHVSAYEMGLDFFQPWRFKTHSVGLLTIRCVLPRQRAGCA